LEGAEEIKGFEAATAAAVEAERLILVAGMAVLSGVEEMESRLREWAKVRGKFARRERSVFCS